MQENGSKLLICQLDTADFLLASEKKLEQQAKICGESFEFINLRK